MVNRYGSDSETFICYLHKANIVYRLLKALRQVKDKTPSPTGSILRVLKVLDFFACQQFDRSVSDEFIEVSMSVLPKDNKNMDSESLNITASVFDLIREHLSHLVKLHCTMASKSSPSDTADAVHIRDAGGFQSPAAGLQEIIDTPTPQASSVVVNDGTTAILEHKDDSQSMKESLVYVLERLLHHKLGYHLAVYFKELQPELNPTQLQHGVSLLLEALKAAEVTGNSGQMVDDTNFSQQISLPQLLTELYKIPQQSNYELSTMLKEVLTLLKPVNKKPPPMKKSSSARSANSISTLSSTSSTHSTMRLGNSKPVDTRTKDQGKKTSFLIASFQSSTLHFLRGKKIKTTKVTPEEKSNLT